MLLSVLNMLDKLKLALGIEDTNQDDALRLLLDDVRSDILSWTNRTKLPVALYPTVRQIAIIRYNMGGIEGQISHAEGAVSRTFDELPAPIRKTIVAYRQLKLVRYATM